jgi:hypothetical protein
MLIVGGVAVVLGLAAGMVVASFSAENRTYNTAVRDGKAIYDRVLEASETVEQAKRQVDEAVKAAKGGPGEKPAVAYDAIEKLRSLEKPFDAGDFARKRYGAFQPGTVDALFEYYNNVNQLWDRFGSLASQTLPESRRERLEAAVQAAGDMASQQTGCVLDEVEDKGILCGLVFVHKPEEGDEPGKVQVSTSQRGRTFEKTLFRGQEDLLENPSEYVILTHTQRSVGVLGQSASLFAEYQRDLLSIKQLMNSTMEVQGRLEQGLGRIKSLEEQFTLF